MQYSSSSTLRWMPPAALDPLEAGQVAALVADAAVVSAGWLGEVGVVAVPATRG